MRSWAFVVLVIVGLAGRVRAETPATAINAVIGDASWIQGRAGSEEDRIRAHLTYVGEMLAARAVPGEPRGAESDRERDHGPDHDRALSQFG